MKNYEPNTSIEKMERQIQYLYHDYKALLNRHDSFNDLKELRMQIKQAEESLRLIKRMLLN